MPSKEWQFPTKGEHVDPRTDAEVARDEDKAQEAETKARAAKNKARKVADNKKAPTSK